jgi:hypothetical protein
MAGKGIARSEKKNQGRRLLVKPDFDPLYSWFNIAAPQNSLNVINGITSLFFNRLSLQVVLPKA